MKPTKQTVKVNESALDMFAKYGVKSIQKGSTEIKLVKSKKKMVKNIKKQTVYLPVEDFITPVKEEGYFFTTEQLNEYTANVVRQALETAAEKAEIEQKGYFEATPEECLKGVEIYDDNGSDRPSFIAFVNKQSITNTFEETYKKFEV